MPKKKKSIDRLLESLQERSKELNCLFQIEEILSGHDRPLTEVCPRIIMAIPDGLQYSEHCRARIAIENQTFVSSDFMESQWAHSTDIVIHDVVVGTLSVFYVREMPVEDHGPFLEEEVKLIKTIAERLGHFIMHQKMRDIVQEWDRWWDGADDKRCGEWQVVLEMLRNTDRNLFLNISRKMLNHLCWSGVADAERLYQSFGVDHKAVEEDELLEEWNQPQQRRVLGFSVDFSAAAFKIASENLSDQEILKLIQKWIQEDKLSFLVQVVNRNLSLSEVADAIRRYHHLMQDETNAPSAGRKGVLVSLVRRFLSDQLQYLNIAKDYIRVRDFYHLLRNVIFSAESHGKLGGKSAGLYLAAQILRKKGEENELLSNVKIPKTWHITSDGLLHFMHYNNFDEVVEQKYKEINQVRLEYPHIVQTFKSALFPTDIVKGLSLLLDDFEERPAIVRSSSLLEDRMGAAFSGKYKSLFLANQGSKQKRLNALMDAIAEVYASTFGPDPIEYRAERGLIDFGEEMGIIIQEVVGNRIGRYFLPSFAGVAFSNNEFRWSPRIDRKDGLVRIVPGMGTRAVDRLSDDYPILISPGQPGLQVNVTPEEVVRYSPKKVDVINIETNSFETVTLDYLLKEVGYQIPGINNIVSVFRDNHIRRPMGMNVDFDNDDLVVTFDGLINHTPFVKQMQTILRTLEETIGMPVDIEFASDGRDFYLLQCRPQSFTDESAPAQIPKDIAREDIIFTARKYISNGSVPDITHIVYVVPEAYGMLSERTDIVEIGRVVGKLNKLLPKHKFILLGPGRWGSRGDIKLGVNVTYSDINKTAVLCEIARKKGNYVPDLSFGTHFFQDLVEAGIRYLPLYPDDDGNVFNENFLMNTRNILPDVLPEYAHLANTVRLIDVQQSSNGKILRVLMNAELDIAMGHLAAPGSGPEPAGIPAPAMRSVLAMENSITTSTPSRRVTDDHWRWRMQMAERLAAELDGDIFGVAGVYLFGSTKNGTAGPGSDINLLVHFCGDGGQLDKLNLWLDGWSQALAELNFMRTGIRAEGLLNVHLVSDEDIQKKSGYAVKIDAVTDAARPLKLKRSARCDQK